MKNYVFNELSLPFSNKWAAQQKMKQFLETCTYCRKELNFGDLLIHENLGYNLYHLHLTENYAVFNWLEQADSTEEGLFLDIITASPLLTQEDNEFDSWNWSGYYYANRRAYGLGAACLLDTLAVSFDSSVDWETPEIGITKKYFDEQEIEQTIPHTIKHASSTEHAESHRAFFHKQRSDNLESGKELWERREEFFPSLIFCKAVQKKLSEIGSSKELHQIGWRLDRLNKYAEQWNQGDYNNNEAKNFGLDISGESDCTRNNERVYCLRRFRLPNGKREYFDWHIKTGNLRFHFFPDNTNRKIYIGYIGPHLPTCKES